MELTVEPIWAWWWVAATAAALVGLVLSIDRAQLRRLPPWRRRLLLTMKLAAVAVLVLAMLRPAIQYSEADEKSAQILVLTDVSRSMNTADGPAGATRFQSVKDDLNRSSSHWTALKQKIDIRRFEFDRTLRPLDENRTAGDGDMTAIGQTLEDIRREARLHRTLAILLMTDGAQRAISPNDIDPLLSARKLAEEQAPVYPVGYGATSLSNTTFDVAVQDLLVDPVVFEKKLVPLKVQVRSTGSSGQKVQLRVLIEDRLGKSPGQSGELKPASVALNAQPVVEHLLRRDGEPETVELSFVATSAGELKVAVEAVPVDGELLTRNNRVETMITIRQGGLRVAYFDTPRPEQYFLRSVNGADKIQLDYFEVRGGKFRTQTVIPAAAFQPRAYDVYLIGDVPAVVFGTTNLKLLADRVRDGAGFMMTGGLQNFGGGGYGNSPLADLLPVLLSPPQSRPDTPDLQSQLTGPQSIAPTELGLKRYVMQLATGEKNRARWETLDPLMGATRLTPKNEFVEVWAATRDGQPLLIASTVGQARVAAFGGDTTYQWFLHGQAEEHQRFWRQMILWLARKEADSDQPVWVRVNPRNFVPGATVPLEFGARSATGEAVTDVTFQVQVTRPNGDVVPAAVRSSNGEFSADFTETEEPGEYWVRVSARRNGQTVGLDALTRFLVDPRDLELDQPNADYDLLKKIAELTGGRLLRSEDLHGFLERLESLKLDDLSHLHVTPLWDNWWVLLTFVAIMATEWTVRKRSGLA